MKALMLSPDGVGLIDIWTVPDRIYIPSTSLFPSAKATLKILEHKAVYKLIHTSADLACYELTRE